jgi:hypothetical protein
LSARFDERCRKSRSRSPSISHRSGRASRVVVTLLEVVPMSNYQEVSLAMYQERAAQARQHEDHRQKLTSLILVLAGALLAFVSREPSWKVSDLYLTRRVIGLGFGCVRSASRLRTRRKQCIRLIEPRWRDHLTYARLRDSIDRRDAPIAAGFRGASGGVCIVCGSLYQYPLRWSGSFSPWQSAQTNMRRALQAKHPRQELG